MYVRDVWSHFMSRNINLRCVLNLCVALMRNNWPALRGSPNAVLMLGHRLRREINFNPFKPEFIHYKPRIAVAILDLQWMKMIWNGLKIEENCHVLGKPVSWKFLF